MDNHKKHSLGHRAFFLFLSRKLGWVIILFLIAAAAQYSERWVPIDYLIWSDYIVKLLYLLSIAYALMILAFTYLAYRVYTYMFTDEAFIMTSGVAVRNEVAALYHQIQNVNISRGPLDRVIGVSQIIIFLNGSEKDSPHNKITLPAVGKTKAKLVQKELLTRARQHMYRDVPSGTETD